MDKNAFIEDLNNVKGIVALCKFGSHGTEYWNQGISDIDIAVVVKPNVSYMDTLKIEDTLEEKLRRYYAYDNIHQTFILYKNFQDKYARMAVDSKEQFIIDHNLWYDFQHYVLKFARNNAEFERILAIDEQYTYFGGLIDESIL